MNLRIVLPATVAIFLSTSLLFAAEPICISGIYPHLAMWNEEGECGTGAVVPWQGELWCITYAPHKPGGSSDKLYRVTPELQQIIFPGSVGGTPANRMIHRESDQLLIGPYVIDSQRNIRVIPPTKMFGRLTGNARHLTDPQHKVYYATMEEGLYEVDVNTLAVTCLIRDGNSGAPQQGIESQLPGYHGKGLYSGQGRLVYANNGERHPDIATNPTIPSGALAQWFGEGDWQPVRRNQFTEVTGPDGIRGSSNPAETPIWTLGWDARSLLLGLLEEGEWSFYRLPKGSHSYDGSHGWNTEWPRIREIGQEDLLATMHGTFWRFPATFSRENAAGIAPRSNYLKVVGDFCNWNGQVVLGCDDSAKSEFLNKRSFKAEHASARQSNSNLWFVEHERLDQLGPPIGRGSVWLREDLSPRQTSDPYLFSGYEHRQLHLSHASPSEVTFQLEVDRAGTNQWTALRDITVPAGEAVSLVFEAEETGAWIRLTSRQAAKSVTANFQYRSRDIRGESPAAMFAGIVPVGEPAHSYGLMRSLAHDRLGLVSSQNPSGQEASYYELTPTMELVPVDIPAGASGLVAEVSQPAKAFTVDAASVLMVEDGKRYRLPKSDLHATEPVTSANELPSLADLLSKNLALGAEVKASAAHGEYHPAKAVDGSLADDDRWIAPQGDQPKWLQLDLGQAKTFQTIWLVTGWKNSAEYVASDFDIQHKVNGTWQTLPGGSVRSNGQVQREVVLEQQVTAQQLRVISESADYFRLYEVALFAERPKVQSTSIASFARARVCREVATERDLLNVHGTFYELPARNAQGMAKLRPVATHNLAIHDFCSHAGLLLMTGLDANTHSEHIFRSSDGKAAVWAGVVDDLWQLGKPRGTGGPWMQSTVVANEPSDPYLMTGYDRKRVELTATDNAIITLEVDVDGTGLWIAYREFELTAGEILEHEFPEGFSAYWVRAVSDTDTTASVQFTYD